MRRSTLRYAVPGFALLFLVAAAFLAFSRTGAVSGEQMKVQLDQMYTTRQLSVLNLDSVEPAVELAPRAAPGGGWALHLESEGFIFPSGDAPIVPGAASARGYAEIYLDGQLIGRADRPVFPLPALRGGTHVFGALLTDMDGNPYAYKDKILYRVVEGVVSPLGFSERTRY